MRQQLLSILLVAATTLCAQAYQQTPITGATHGSIVPAQSEDVMLQGFYWDSHNLTKYGRTKWVDLNNGTTKTIQNIADAGFTMIWLPSPVASDGGLGYHPKCWSDFSSGLGTATNLKTLVSSLHNRGVKVIADIVVNHRANSSSWCDFRQDNFGSKYGSTESPSGVYQFTNNHIVSDDEAITQGKCTTTGAKDSGVEAYAAARDLDHANPYVRAAVKSYLAYLQGEVGFDGWRYDLVKSYSPSYLRQYNEASTPYLSVAEYFDGDTTRLKTYIRNAGYKTLVFDFATKFALFQGNSNSLGNSNNGGYTKLLRASRGNMLIQCPGFSRYAVTFMDNHDTFERSDSQNNEYLGYNVDITSNANKNRILEGYAYLLTMPGIPCVFWPHWVKHTTEINQLIAARHLVGIHSESSILEEEGRNGASAGYYQAKIQGKRGTAVLQIGTASALSQLNAPSGYTLYASGTKYRIYVETGTGIRDERMDARRSYKGVENGKVVIYTPAGKYDMMGRKISNL